MEDVIRYHGYVLPDGKHVTRNNLPLYSVVINAYGLVLTGPYNWGPKAVYNVELAFNLLYDVSGDTRFALKFALLFNWQILAAFGDREEWELTAECIRDWADKLDLINPDQVRVRFFDLSTEVRNFPRRAMEVKSVKGDESSSRAAGGRSDVGSRGSDPVQEPKQPIGTLESERFPANRDKRKNG